MNCLVRLSLGIIILGFIQLLHVPAVNPFYQRTVVYSQDVSQFVYSLTCWWTFGLFPFLAIRTKLLRTFGYKSLYKHMLSFLVTKYLGVEWLGHMVSVRLAFQETKEAKYHQRKCTAGKWEISISLLQFCCEPKTSLKKSFSKAVAPFFIFPSEASKSASFPKASGTLGCLILHILDIVYFHGFNFEAC